MKRAWVEFTTTPSRGHMGSPPSTPVPGMGFPQIFVEFENITFEFITAAEMVEAADILDRGLVDRVTSQQRWYRKLPASVKGKHARGRAAANLRKAAKAYEVQVSEWLKKPSPIAPDAGGRPFRADVRL